MFKVYKWQPNVHQVTALGYGFPKRYDTLVVGVIYIEYQYNINTRPHPPPLKPPLRNKGGKEAYIF